MKNAIFLNNIAMSPAAEMHWAHINNGKIDLVVWCGGKLKYCHANPCGFSSICKHCSSRSKFLLEKYKHIPNINIDDFVDEITDLDRASISNRILNNLFLGVMSSFASLLRVTYYKDLDFIQRRYCELMKYSTFQVFLIWNKIIATNNLSQLFVFNGRFAWSNALRVSAKENKCNIVVYDVKKSISYYEFINSSLHDIHANAKKALIFWNISTEEQQNNARKFFQNKLDGVDTYEKSYTKSQAKKSLPSIFKTNKKILSIFPSSDDEYRYIGSDFGGKIVDQLDSIEFLVKNLPDNFAVCIRLHPNMISMHRTHLARYKNLQSANTFVSDPDSDHDTYEILFKSDFVVTFCSSIGFEAAYYELPVVQIGDSAFSGLDICPKFENVDEALQAILENNVKQPYNSRQNATIWSNYLLHYNDNLPSFEINSSSREYFVENKKMPAHRLLRVMRLPAKSIQLMIFNKLSILSLIKKIPITIKNTLSNSWSFER